MYQWCEFKSRRGKNKKLTALKSNFNTVWFNFQAYIYKKRTKRIFHNILVLTFSLLLQIFRYNVHKLYILVPAIDPEDYLKKTGSKRSITATKWENCQSTKIVERSVRNNLKCFVIPPRKSQQHSNSFFLKHLLDWIII